MADTDESSPGDLVRRYQYARQRFIKEAASFYRDVIGPDWESRDELRDASAIDPEALHFHVIREEYLEAKSAMFGLFEVASVKA